MTIPINIASLFVAQSVAKILETGLQVATVLGLPTTSWRAGDPTKVVFYVLAEVLASREAVTAEFIKSGFLSSAEGEWLTVLAHEVYGVERTLATYATATVTLTNTGGGYYPRDAGDLTFKSSASGQTYTSTSDGVLSAGSTVTFDVVADVAGSDGSAAINEIDELVTTLIGVSVVSSTVAQGVDEQSDASVREQCEATLGALSPNGPADAYEFVARNVALTGVLDVARAASTDDALDGTVTVYVASTTGAVAGASIVAVQAAIDQWATPLTVTATVVNATPVALNIVGTISGDDIPAGAAALIDSAIAELFSTVPIGGTISVSAIVSKVHTLLVTVGASNVSVTVTSPASTIALGEGEVATVATVSLPEV